MEAELSFEMKDWRFLFLTVFDFVEKPPFRSSFLGLYLEGDGIVVAGASLSLVLLRRWRPLGVCWLPSCVESASKRLFGFLIDHCAQVLSAFTNFDLRLSPLVSTSTRS